MNWKLLLIGLCLVVGIFARPADETPQVKVEATTTAQLAVETTNLTEKSITEALKETTTVASKPKTDAPTTVRYELLKKHDNIVSEKQLTDENRELKASSNLQLTSNNGVASEITLKESYHHGVAVPLSLEEYEKELAREKDMINKAKKKIAMESSTPKEGISTWILLSGSHDPPTTSRPDTVKPTYRIENAEKKPVKNTNTSPSSVTKKRNPVTAGTKIHPKPTQKVHNNNKLITRVKVSSNSNEASKEESEILPSSTAASTTTTKKAHQTTKKKFTTTRPKPTTTRSPPTPKTTTTTTFTTSTTPEIIQDDSMVIDDEKDEIQPIKSTSEPTFLVMEAKESEFNLPDDRSPTKAAATKKTATKTTSAKPKKKKIATTISPLTATNSTKIKKKTKTALSKLSSKKPEKPITTQIYNFLAREVMPTVGVGLVGLVVTAGLATYFLGGPLGALRRSYDIANRRDDVAFDRSDDFGNAHDEGEMFGKVIAGMPENSAYRNNLRLNAYRQKPGQPQAQAQTQYNTYPQLAQQKYQAQLQQQQLQQQQQQFLRYRAADPYYNSYPQQNYVQPPQQQQQQQQQASQPQPYYQQAQAKSSDYGTAQSIQAVTENAQKFNIESVDMTTSEPASPSYQIDYDEIAQSYFPQRDDPPQISIEEQKMQEVQKPQPAYDPQSEVRSNEKLTIVNAQSVPSNHKKEGDSLPEPEALKMLSGSDEEYQNSIANAILNQKNQRKQFVVGSVISDNFEESPGSIVPEHGPRRRRNTSEVEKKLEDNEIDLDEEESDVKRQAEIVEITTSSTTTENHSENIESETTTQTYDISNGQNNVFQLFKRIFELKLRLGLNFLQNATLAFQQYLRGVEERVHASPLFNPYINNTSSNSTMNRKSTNKDQREKVENL